MTNVKKEISKVKLRLRDLDRRIKLLSLAKGSFFFLASAMLTFLSLSLLESLGLHSSDERTLLFSIGLLLLLGFAVKFLFIPIYNLVKPLSNKDYLALADLVGGNFAEIKDKLLNALQLNSELSEDSSPDLRSAAIIATLEKTKHLNFNSIVSFSFRKEKIVLLLGFVFFISLLFFVWGGLDNSLARIINYNKEFIIPAKIQFNVIPGNAAVTKGDNVNISVRLKGDAPDNLFIAVRNKENRTFVKTELLPDSTGVYKFIFRKINLTSEYFFDADGIISRHYKIKVINPPMIKGLELEVVPPKYSGISKFIQKDNGNISALYGSVVRLKFSSSNYLSSALLVFSDSSKSAIKIVDNKGEVKFSVKTARRYFISLVDTNGNKNLHPIEYSIKPITDEYPEIEIIEPLGDVALTKSEKVLTAMNIRDDYGFSNLLIKHRLSATNFGVPEKKFSVQKIKIKKSELNQNVVFNWDLSNRMLTAGDVVTFYFEVFDNDNISGPKSSKSKMFLLRIPTMEEILNSAENQQEDAKTNLEETLKEAEELKEEMKKLSNELKKDEKKITWDEKKKIEETSKRLEKLQEKIRKAQESIEKSKQNLDDNNMLSKETLKKYEELQKLMDEMNSEEMKRAMEKMQQQLKSMNRDKAQQSLEQMEFNEEMFRKSLERTVNLLKRIQIEQKTDEIIKRIEKLKKDSEKLKEEINKSNLKKNEDRKKLEKRKDEIEKELKNLKEEMKNLQKKMSEFKKMPNDEMKKIQSDLEKQKNEELAKKMEEMLKQNIKMDAMNQMEQFSQNMEQMKSQMEQMQQQMQQQTQMEVLYEMMKNVDNLLSLSKDEENLKNRMNNNLSGSKENLNNMRRQKEISDGLDKTMQGLSELSQKTFAITPEMGKALGNANREMNKAMQAMQNGGGSLAVLSQKAAMKYLNEAATMMKGNMEQMMNGGQGGGMMSMLQQMQQMSQQQMSINQLTKQMQQGRLTPQQQAQMRRLQQQQELIRKSLEELNRENKESGKSKALATNLEKVLEEMKEVITKMNTEKINDDLIKSQENILSKLLDAQRSINQRDFEKNRESKSSKNFVRTSPDDLNLIEKNDRIKEELMKLINEGYSKDYEELIRKYYEILEKEKENEISK